MGEQSLEHRTPNSAALALADGRAGRSLGEYHSSVPVPSETAGFWKQWRAFTGPAILISVGYMDPGNWGTDLRGGAAYRYDMLWVVALASLMAIVLQLFAARLGIVAGKDLAQACRDHFPAWTRLPNWLLCESAIMACDLAEVLGSAVAINVLFGIPLFWAVIITAFDVLLLLALQRLGMRFIEAVILMLVLTIGVCYFVEIVILPQTKPDVREMATALISPGFRQNGMIVLAIGIIGATVMPHNLYLHSALVQSRRLGSGASDVRRSLKFNAIDTCAALSVAFLVNAAIMVLAATMFHGKSEVRLEGGQVIALNDDSDWIMVAYLTLAPLLGTALAGGLFAIALLASGQSSTVTGTMAGQVVMEGFLHWRLSPSLRRLITRLLAVIPAILIIGLRGDGSVTDLLVLSQVVLALQLPFAMIPLLYFCSSRRLMGKHLPARWLIAVGWTTCLLITALDIYGLPDSFRDAWRVVVGPGPTVE